MFGVSALLLNTLFILLPILTYELIVGRLPAIPAKTNYILISTLTSAAAILCMTFPVALVPGFSYDLRPIPLMISCLYGGPKTGVITMAAILLYRSFGGGIGFYVSLATLGTQAITAMYLSRRFQSTRLSTKLSMSGSLVLVENVLRTTVTFAIEPKLRHNTLFYILFFIISICTMALAVSLIEYMKQNYYIRAELARTEKLRVVSELAASIAHEVRNPMTTVRGFAQLLNEDPLVRERHSMELSVMITELDRAHQIISDYLSFARPHEGNVQSIDVVQHIARAVTVLTPYANARSVNIDETYEGALYVQGQAARFEQAMINVIKNAIESMQDHGTVTVRAKTIENQIKVEVIDTGCGMTETEISRLGTPFYTTKNSGTGLGLTSTYQIIYLMNGKIEVNSVRNVGTTFEITLPPSAPPAEAASMTTVPVKLLERMVHE